MLSLHPICCHIICYWKHMPNQGIRLMDNAPKTFCMLYKTPKANDQMPGPMLLWCKHYYMILLPSPMLNRKPKNCTVWPKTRAWSSIWINYNLPCWILHCYSQIGSSRRTSMHGSGMQSQAPAGSNSWHSCTGLPQSLCPSQHTVGVPPVLSKLHCCITTAPFQQKSSWKNLMKLRIYIVRYVVDKNKTGML